MHVRLNDKYIKYGLDLYSASIKYGINSAVRLRTYFEKILGIVQFLL